MSLSQLEKFQWQPYLDNMSRILDSKRVEIEVDALDIGAQIAAEWLPLFGIVYDPRSDIVEVALEGLDHMIHHPKEIFIDQTGLELRNIKVVDAQDMQHIIRLRDPLVLPAPLAQM